MCSYMCIHHIYVHVCTWTHTHKYLQDSEIIDCNKKWSDNMNSSASIWLLEILHHNILRNVLWSQNPWLKFSCNHWSAWVSDLGFLSLLFFFTLIDGRTHTCHMWRSENDLWSQVSLSILWILRTSGLAASECVYLLSHLAEPGPQEFF